MWEGARNSEFIHALRSKRSHSFISNYPPHLCQIKIRGYLPLYLTYMFLAEQGSFCENSKIS